MANLSPAAIAALRASVNDWSPDNAALVASLNAPSVPNPTPQPIVPKPFTFADVMICLSSTSRANVRDLACATALIEQINAGDRVGIGHWLVVLQDAPAKITADEATAVMAVLQASEPDPDWLPQFSWAQAYLGRSVDESDVQEARP